MRLGEPQTAPVASQLIRKAEVVKASEGFPYSRPREEPPGQRPAVGMACGGKGLRWQSLGMLQNLVSTMGAGECRGVGSERLTWLTLYEDGCSLEKRLNRTQGTS